MARKISTTMSCVRHVDGNKKNKSKLDGSASGENKVFLFIPYFFFSFMLISLLHAHNIMCGARKEKSERMGSECAIGVS